MMKEKKVYLEWMRILAILLVLFNHTPGFALYPDAQGVSRALLLLLTAFTRINVPLFLMVSGAVLLGKKEPLRLVLQKRFLRFALVTALFAFGIYALHALYFLVYQREEFDFSLSRLLYGLLDGSLPGTESYWFLYGYLGFLLVLPWMRRIAQGLRRGEVILLLLLYALLYTLLPAANLLLAAWHAPAVKLHAAFIPPAALSQFFLYPLLGYYLDRKIDIAALSRRHLAMIALAGVAGLAVTGGCMALEAAVKGAFSERLVDLCAYVTAMAAFLLIKRLCLVSRPGLGRGMAAEAACGLGGLTFGVYLLDPYWKVLFWGPVYLLLTRFMPPLPASILWCFFAMAAGCLLTWALKKLPGVRKLL